MSARDLSVAGATTPSAVVAEPPPLFREITNGSTITSSSSEPRLISSNNNNIPINNSLDANTSPSDSLEASSAIVRAIFGSAVGDCWGDFFCTHNRIRGRLYATSLAVLFYSNLLGFERRICLRFCEIVEMELHRTTSIRITMFDSEMYVFRSFNDRVQVLHMLKGLKILSDRRVFRTRSTTANGTRTRTASTGASASNSSGNEGSTGKSKNIQNDASAVLLPNTDMNIPATGTTTTTATSSAPLPSLHTPPRQSSLLPSSSPPSSSSSYEPLVSNRRRSVSDSNVTVLSTAFDPLPQQQSQNGRSIVNEQQQHGVDDDDDDDESVVNMNNNEESVEVAWNKAKESSRSFPETIGIESLVLPVTLERFYQMFLADGAPYSLDWYQQTFVGDRDIELTGWDVDLSSGDDHNTAHSHNHHNGGGGSSSSNNKNTNNNDFFTRSMTFTHPIKNAFVGIGPSEARTMRQQRLRRFGDLGITVENTTVIVDTNIPSADAFYVQDHWLVEASSNNSKRTTDSNNNHIDCKDQVTLSTRFGTRFTKRALFRGMIEKSVLKETQQWFQDYADMLRTKVQEQPKLMPTTTTTTADAEAAAATVVASIDTAAESSKIPTAVMAADTSLTAIIQLLQKISGSMDRALSLVVCALLVFGVILLVQLYLMHQTIALMRIEILTLRQDLDKIHHCSVLP